MSDLAVESVPAVAPAAHEAARGRVVYLTEHGDRIAGIVPLELAAILQWVTSDEFDELAAAADLAGLINAALLMEELSDRAAVLESRAEPSTGVPWQQPSAEVSVSYPITWSEKASKHLRQLDKLVKKRLVGTVNDLADNPRPAGVKPVMGLPGVFRIREGRYRILYAVDDDRRTIRIEDVRHHSKVHGSH